MVLNMKASDFDRTDSIHLVAASNFACLVLMDIPSEGVHRSGVEELMEISW